MYLLYPGLSRVASYNIDYPRNRTIDNRDTAVAYEVELKIRVGCDVLDELRKRIVGKGGVFQVSREETDYYFVHPCRDFLESDEALRARFVDGKIESLTYKGPRLKRDLKTRYEIVVKISSGDIIELLNRLGFKVGVVVVKKRDYYKYNDVLVTLDVVKDLGCFVELELLGDSEDLLDSIVEELGIEGKVVKESYAELLMNKKIGSLDRF